MKWNSLTPALLALLLPTALWSATGFRTPEQARQDERSELVKKIKIEFQKKLSVYHAPALFHRIETLMRRLQEKAGLSDRTLLLGLESTKRANAAVTDLNKGGKVSDVPVYALKMSKGILDFLQDPKSLLPDIDEETARIAEDSDGLVAGIIAHELGHIANGDLAKKEDNYNRVYPELDADEYAVRLLHSAGYHPRVYYNVLKLLEAIENAETTDDSKLLGAILNYHPAPILRMANVLPLVERLERENEARIEFGFSEEPPVFIAPKRLPDDLRAHPSLESYAGITGKLSKAGYAQKPFREKLAFLEQFPHTYLSARYRTETTEALVDEYTRLVKGLNTLDEIDVLISSLKRFEEAAGLGERRAGKSETETALRNLKKHVSARQVQVLNAEYGTTILPLDRMRHWGGYLDRPVAFGVLVQNMQQATNLPDLKTLYFKVMDESHRLAIRFNRGQKNDKVHLDFDTKLHAEFAARALTLTRNVEKAVDFLQEVIPLTRGNPDAQMKHAGAIFGGLIERLVEDPSLSMGDLLDRMAKPRSQIDKAYAHIMKNATADVSLYLARKWRMHAQLYDKHSHHQYREAPTQLPQGAIPRDHWRFFAGMVEDYIANYVFNAKIKTRYTLAETLDLLKEQEPSQISFWNRVGPRVLSADGSSIPREISANAARIERALAKIEPEALAAKGESRSHVGQALDTLRKSSTSRITTNLRGAIAAYPLYEPSFLDAKQGLGHRDERDDGNERAKRLAEELQGLSIDTKHLAAIPIEDRAKVLEDVFRKREIAIAKHRDAVLLDLLPQWRDALEKATRSDPDSRNRRSDLEPRLAFLPEPTDAKPRKLLSAKLIDELERLGRECAAAIRPLVDGKTDTLPPDYGRKRRQLATILATMNLRKKFDKKEHPLIKPFGEKGPLLARWLEENDERSLELRHTRLFNDLIAIDAAAFERRWHSAPPDEKKRVLDGRMRHLAEICRVTARYSGMDEKPIELDVGSLLASDFHHAIRHQHDRDDRPRLKLAHALGDEAKTTLLNLPPAWQKELSSRESALNYALKLNGHRLIQSSIEEKDALKSLAYAFAAHAHSGSIVPIRLALVAQALEKVQTASQMKLFATLLGHQLRSGRDNAFKNAGQEAALVSVQNSSVVIDQGKQAEVLSERLIERLDEFGAWPNGRKTHPGRLGLLAELYEVLHGRPGTSDTTVFVQYSKALRKLGYKIGPITKSDFLTALRTNVPWAKGVDTAIAEHIETEVLTSRSLSKRRKALDLASEIRSMEVRARVLEQIWASLGEPNESLFSRLSNAVALRSAYRTALKYWTEQELQSFRNMPLARAAFEAGALAARKSIRGGYDAEAALNSLKRLHDTYETVQHPAIGEVTKVFPEGSKHRDDFLRRWSKKNPLSPLQIGKFETFTSRKTNTPLHQFNKSVLETLNYYLADLSAPERGILAEYLAGMREKLTPELEERLEKRYYGKDARARALRRHGLRMEFGRVKTFLSEFHPEDRAVFFRSLFLGANGISRSPETERGLFRSLLLQDPSMPHYLRRVLEIYFSHNNPSERSILLSGLLSRQEHGKKLSGPEVLRLIIAEGGVLPAKLGQLVASHGFNLPVEYRRELEVFKGSAQEMFIASGLRLLKERLPEPIYRQIKSIDRELGSGGLKVGYLVRLEDGRKIAVKVAREHILGKLSREFELLDLCLKDIMADPDLKMDSLPGIADEVKRLVREELDFRREKDKILDHRHALANRPLLVRMLGQDAEVYIPRPIDDWNHEGVSADEYVPAKSWGALPQKSLFGWSKEKLARAAMQNIVNELLAYLNPAEQLEGRVILDIDPHEENHLARLGLTRRQLIDIDFGQSVRVPAEDVRRFVGLVYHTYRAENDRMMEIADQLMQFKDPSERVFLEETITAGMKRSKDPVEAVTKALELAELKGITLKPEYLFLQKLFATANGLQQHVRNKAFLVNEMKKGLFLRAIALGPKAVRDFSREIPGICRQVLSSLRLL